MTAVRTVRRDDVRTRLAIAWRSSASAVVGLANLTSSSEVSAITSWNSRALRATLEKLYDSPIVMTSARGISFGIELLKD